jgi:hypothetical protein
LAVNFPAKILLPCVLALGGFLTVHAQVNVLTYHNDNARSGQNTNETILTPANVNTNGFLKLFTTQVDGYVYAQPLYVSGLNIPGKGVHNVVFIATEHNSIYAFDADSNLGASGGLLWQVNLGLSAATPNTDFGNQYGPYTTLVPEVGITSTPVIDLASGTIYVDAFTHDGPQLYNHRIHALNILNGAEQPSSPVVVAASVPGQGYDNVNGIVSFNAMQELQRSALTLAGGMVYAAYAAYDDTDPYHGWIIGFEASSLQPLTNFVFNDSPNSSGSTSSGETGRGGIWMSGNGLAVDANTNLYVVTGNGAFDGTSSTLGTEFGDSVVRLATTNGLEAADFFSPFNQNHLAAVDEDLGSGGPLLLPDSVSNLAHPHLMAVSGKEGKVYLLDRDNLGRYNSFGDAGVVQEVADVSNGTWSSPAYFNNLLYFLGSGDVGSSDVMRAFLVTNGSLVTAPVSATTSPFGFPGATPSVSAGGTNNAIVWALQTDGYDTSSPATLHAYNAYDLSQELYNSDQAGARDRCGAAVKFAVPTIANGKVYVGGEYSFSVFGLTSTNSLPPVLSQFFWSSKNFQFSVTVSPGQTCTVQMSTNLDSASWVSLLVTNPPFNTFQVTDPNATNPRCFYRVLQGP